MTLRLLVTVGMLAGAVQSSPMSMAAAVQEQPAPKTRAEILSAARAVMESARFCGLITIGEDGQPQAREVDPFAPEDDMTVWLATKAVTRKVAQIRRDARVTLYYQAPDGSGYVTYFGRAAIVTDAAEKAKRWKDAWAPLYDDRNEGADYTLIKVTPVRLEILSLAHGVVGDPVTWRPVSVDFGR
jgi:general stress protein 26